MCNGVCSCISKKMRKQNLSAYPKMGEQNLKGLGRKEEFLVGFVAGVGL